jgi:hypothetical protein
MKGLATRKRLEVAALLLGGPRAIDRGMHTLGNHGMHDFGNPVCVVGDGPSNLNHG